MNLTYEQVIEILKRIELRLGMMQKRKYEFYSECGLSSALYSNWNTGKAKPSAAMLGRIAEYLNVSYEWLISGKEDKKITATDGDGKHEYLNNIVDQLNFENQIRLANFLQELLQDQLNQDAQKRSN